MISIRRLALLLVLVSVVGLTSPAPARTPLLAGVGRADITWHVGDRASTTQIANTPAQAPYPGVHLRVYAKALVLRRGGERVAMVHGEFLLVTSELRALVARLVHEQTGIPEDNVVVTATHSHMATTPLFFHVVHGAAFYGADPRLLGFVASRMAAAVVEANGNLEAVRVGVASMTENDLARNRRHDGGPIDPELTLIRFDRSSGEPLAFLMNVGIHPTTLCCGSENNLLTGDYVGYWERMVESTLGAPAIYFQGTEGDVEPDAVTARYRDSERMAIDLTADVVALAGSMQTAEDASFDIVSKWIPLPDPRGGQPTATFPNVVVVTGVEDLPVTGPVAFQVPNRALLQAIRIGDAVISTVPGEPVTELGMAIKRGVQSLGFRQPLVFAHANDWAGYMLTKNEYDQGGYERIFHFYGPGEADYIIEQALDLVAKLADPSHRLERLPLSPQAVAQQWLVDAEVAAYRYAVSPGLEAAGPAVPPDADSVGSVVTQPHDAARLGRVSFEWVGGNPDIASGYLPDVALERQTPGGWQRVADSTGYELLTRYRRDSTDHVWSVEWQPLQEALTGTYRFAVSGHFQQAQGLGLYGVASQPFQVMESHALSVPDMRASREGESVRISFSVSYPDDPGAFRWHPVTAESGSAAVTILPSSGGEIHAAAPFDGSSFVATVNLPSDETYRIFVRVGEAADSYGNVTGADSSPLAFPGQPEPPPPPPPGASGVPVVIANPYFAPRADGLVHLPSYLQGHGGTLRIQVLTPGHPEVKAVQLVFGDQRTDLGPARIDQRGDVRRDGDPSDGFWLDLATADWSAGLYQATFTAYDASGTRVGELPVRVAVDLDDESGQTVAGHTMPSNMTSWPAVYPGDGSPAGGPDTVPAGRVEVRINMGSFLKFGTDPIVTLDGGTPAVVTRGPDYFSARAPQQQVGLVAAGTDALDLDLPHEPTTTTTFVYPFGIGNYPWAPTYSGVVEVGPGPHTLSVTTTHWSGWWTSTKTVSFVAA